MRRRFLSLAMTLVMALTLLPATAWANGSTDYADDAAAIAADMVARIGEAGASGTYYYSSLKEAVAAAPKGDSQQHPEKPTTITLIDDTNDGLDIGDSSGSTPQNIIIDLNEKTLTLGPAVGSPNTETNGLRVLAYSKLEVKNGRVVCSDMQNDQGGHVKVGMANYGTLTLTDVDFKSGPYVQYTINNRGNLTLEGTTSVESGSWSPAVAITNDPYNYSYEDFNATLNIRSEYVNVGKVQVERYGNSQNRGVPEINISAGTVETIFEDGNTEIAVKGNVTGGYFSTLIPANYCSADVVQLVDEDGRSSVVRESTAENQGYLQVEDEDDIYYINETAVAQYNEAKVESGDTTTYYATLEDAIAAVNAMNPAPAEGSEATITLLDDVSITSTPEGGAYEFFALPANTTLNGAMHRITVDVLGLSGHSSWYHVIGTSGTNVRIENLTITGDYQSDSEDYCTRAGIHAYKGAGVAISNVTISRCGSVAVQVNGSTVTADSLNASGNNWGSVNVDRGINVTTTPSFTFNSGNLGDNAQIYTELTTQPDVIKLGDNSGLLPTPVEGVGGSINGKLYYTDNHAKLGEALNEITGKIYVDLDQALSEAQSGKVVTVVRDAKLDANGTIDTGVTLVVAPDVTLTIPDGSTLTNNGTIVNNGTIEGEENIAGGSVTVAVTFNVTPATANATVSIPGVSHVPANDKVFLLLSGETYSYTVSANGYYNYTGSVTVDTDAQTVNVPLTQIPSTPSYDYDDSEPTYSNTLDVSDGGTVKVSPRTPEAGDTVTITPDPDAGYEVDEVIVTDRSGDEVRVTANRNGTYTFKQPRGRVTIEVTFVRTGDTGLPFLDVAENAWYADAVAYVYENGLMSGTASNLFSPDATTTRGMIVTMLYRLEGEPRVTTGSAFNDVDAAMYYADAIAWANANGIVTGYDEATFGPNDAITREQMAAILYRYAQYKGYGTATGGMAIREYADYESISEYALTAMDWAASAGLVTGTSSTTLTPDGSAIRAQVATIFMRFMEDVAG